MRTDKPKKPAKAAQKPAAKPTDGRELTDNELNSVSGGLGSFKAFAVDDETDPTNPTGCVSQF